MRVCAAGEKAHAHAVRVRSSRKAGLLISRDWLGQAQEGQSLPGMSVRVWVSIHLAHSFMQGSS
jgi:hypothetical protein